MTQGWRCWGWQLGLASSLAIIPAIASLGDCALAQIIPDSTLGNENSTVTSTGAVDQIDGGVTKGTNLFHSFEEFNIGNGRSAFFSNPLGIKNILSRVTGANPSNILGTLGVSGGNANLFLINPNGIVFGRNARLDIGGSFVVSTASSLNFADSTQFSATNPEAPPLLTINVPPGLQFGTNQPREITNAGNLAVGQNLTLAGGTVTSTGQLAAPAGQVAVTAVSGDITTANINTSSLLENGGEISLTSDNGAIDTSAGTLDSRSFNSNGGNITLKARNDIITGNVYTIVGGFGNAGNISLTSTAGAIDTRAGSLDANSNESISYSNGGDITLKARNDIITGNVATIVGEFGNAGNISLTSTVGAIDTRAGSLDAGTTFGNGGAITLKAHNDITVYDLRSYVVDNGSGNGGDISLTSTTGGINVTEGVLSSLSVNGSGGDINLTSNLGVSLENSVISSETGGSGKGGNINIMTGSLFMTAGALLRAAAFEQGDATAGSINIQADHLSLSSNASIEADTLSTGPAGNINLDVTGAILLTGGTPAPTGESTRITLSVEPGGGGSGGELTINAGSLVLTDGAIIKANTQGPGNAGNIYVNADIVDISGSVPSSGLPSGLFTSTDTTARAGNIRLDTHTFRIADGAVLSSRSKGGGQSGDIRVDATSSFEAVNGGQLVTTTFGQGKAGNIFVNADQVTLAGSDPNYSDRIAKFPSPIDPLVANNITETGPYSGLFANTLKNSIGQGGSLEINTEQLVVRDWAKVTVSSEGSGGAGNLKVTARSIHLDNQASLSSNITTSSNTTTEQSNIILNSQDLVLRRHSDITTNATGTATGGNITIHTGVLAALEDSDISANASEGPGGRVTIDAQGIFGTEFREDDTRQSDITASSNLGPQFSGTVELNTPDVDPSSGLVDLPEAVVDVSGLVTQRCPTVGGNTARGASEFVVTGRGGLPPSPSDPPSSDTVLADWITFNPKLEETRSSAAPVTKPLSPAPAPLVEAQGWVRNSQGQVVLMAQAPTATPHSSGLASTSCPGS